MRRIRSVRSCLISFLLVKRADVMAHHPDVIPGKLDYLRELEHIWRDVQLHGDCLSLKDLAVSGKDLIADGMTPGPDIGRVLSICLSWCWIIQRKMSMMCSSRRADDIGLVKSRQER